MTRYCKDCYKVGTIVLQMCEKCEGVESEQFYDDETNEYYVEEKPKKVSKYHKHLTAEQLAEKMKKKQERVIEEAARRAEKIRIANEAMAARLREANVCKLLANKYDYSNLTLTQKKEHDILESIIKAAPKGLKIKEVYAEDCAGGMHTRGPKDIPELSNFIQYRKPVGYVSIPLNVKAGQWVGNTGSRDEWIVSYHGTTLEAVQGILKTGFRAGAGQACQSNSNINRYSGNGNLGVGIYCSPILHTAESYSTNKSYDRKYLCVLQCRVNPKMLKVGSDAAWVLNNSSDIQPYKLLVKKR